MRNAAQIVLLALAVLGASAVPASAADDGATPRIVVFDSSVSDVDAATRGRERAYGFTSRFRYHHALRGFSARLSPQQVRRLEADPAVAFVSPDRPVQAVANVPLAAGEPLPPAGVRRTGAATSTTVRQASTANVAVLDSGIDLAHPDLPSAANGKNCISTGAAAQDDYWHGTHVAGTIGAANNGSGVVGAAPGTRMYAVKVLDSAGSGTWSQVICGVDWVTATRSDADPANDVAVANMSLGGSGTVSGTCATTGDALRAAICRSTARGVTYVAAAGNSAKAFDDPASSFVPAAYPEVLTVTAMSDSDGQPGAAGGAPRCSTANADDAAAGFSNYAATAAGAAHAIAAPGVCVRSTSKGGTYSTANGTSMAAPHVAASVALCIGEGGSGGPCSGLTPSQVIERTRTGAASFSAANRGYGFDGDPLRPRAGLYYGYLDWAGLEGAPADTTPPAPPTGLTATAGDAAVALDWNDSAAADGAVGYRVYRATAATGPFTQIAQTPTSAHTDAPLTNGQAYYFRVTAVDGAGNESTASAVASATPAATPAADPEPQPTVGIDLAASGFKVKGLQRVRLTWSGGEAGDFLVMRDGARIATVRSGNGTGAYEDAIGKKGSGSYSYEVCQRAADGSGTECSNAVVVTF